MIKNAITDTVVHDIPFHWALSRSNSVCENIYASAMYLGMSIMLISSLQACNWAAKSNRIRSTASLFVCLVAIVDCNVMLVGAEMLNLDSTDNLAFILLITMLTLIFIYGRMVFFKLISVLARRLGNYLQRKVDESKSRNKE